MIVIVIVHDHNNCISSTSTLSSNSGILEIHITVRSNRPRFRHLDKAYDLGLTLSLEGFSLGSSHQKSPHQEILALRPGVCVDFTI